ncbi:Tetrathionate response regulatory protein TtrR [Planctomycetes bacterium MalM25]|nr:Tetrathionate response regulatory protein TtrR [Planctomycetes bacterium MalM25]
MIVLLQMQDPLDTEAYAHRLKAESRLVVRTDNRSPRRPDLVISDGCPHRTDGAPTLILNRGGHAYVPECDCCQRTTARTRWPAFMKQVYEVLGCSPEPATLDTTDEGIARLTPRERDVLSLVGQGKTVEQCAEAMGIAPSTVGNHKHRLMRKLAAKSSLQLLRIAVRSGLADFK